MARSVQNRYAVIGDPTATRLHAVPFNREQARELKRRHDRRAAGVGGFYCPLVLGGCGGALIVAAGTVNTPHFRHTQDRPPTAPCRASDFEGNQDHIRIQQLLGDHLVFLGYEVSLEYRHENHTRSDLLFRGGDLGGTVRGIEVQLSPQTRERTEERHARYVEGAEAMQWVAHDERPFMPGVLRVKLSPTGDALELVEASPDPLTHQGRSMISEPLAQWRIGPIHQAGAETAFLTCAALEGRRAEDAKRLAEAARQKHERARRASVSAAQRAREDEEKRARWATYWEKTLLSFRPVAAMQNTRHSPDQGVLFTTAPLPRPVVRPGSVFDGLLWEGTESDLWDEAPCEALTEIWPQVRDLLIEQGRLQDYSKPVLREGQPVGSIRRWRVLHPKRCDV